MRIKPELCVNITQAAVRREEFYRVESKGAFITNMFCCWLGRGSVAVARTFKSTQTDFPQGQVWLLKTLDRLTSLQ